MNDNDNDNYQIFLSYANPDQGRVVPFFEALEREGFNIWFDLKRLRPGQNWDFEIKRALDKSSIVIAFLSNNSIARRGYIQREIKMSLDKLSEKLIDDIYIIPVILDIDTPIPEQLKGIQCISANNAQCLEHVSDALKYQLGRLGVETQKTQKKEEISWISHSKKEVWDGLPGYEVELQYFSFKSDRYPAIAEIGEFIKGQMLRSLFQARSVILDQSPTVFNYGQDKYRRTNTYDAYCRDPIIKENVISIQYAVHWYGAGAAHPNTHFETYSFVLNPLLYISSLQDIFNHPEKALETIQESARKQLVAAIAGNMDEEDQENFDQDWIVNGTKDWDSLTSFVFGQESLELLFAPYHVAPYAYGPQYAGIPYEILIEFIKPEYASALGIEHLNFR